MFLLQVVAELVFSSAPAQMVKFICDKIQLSLLLRQAACTIRRLRIVQGLNCKICILMTEFICTLFAKLFACTRRLSAWNHVEKYLPADSTTVLSNAALIVLFRRKLIYVCVLFVFSHENCYACRRQVSWFICACFVADSAALGSRMCFLVCVIWTVSSSWTDHIVCVCVCRLEYVS